MNDQYKFITKDDHFEIRKTLRELFFKNVFLIASRAYHTSDREFLFNIFFNQYIPDPWKASREAVIRHIDEIIKIIKGANSYSPEWVWVEKNNYMDGKSSKALIQSGLTESLYYLIKKNTFRLPIYIEIEKQKQGNQSHPTYKYEERTSPIEEEFVQLRLRKKKDEGR